MSKHVYDERSCITAGELRRAGWDIDPTVPDVAWVPRTSMVVERVAVDRSADVLATGTLPMTVRCTLTEPWRWFETTVESNPAGLRIKALAVMHDLRLVAIDPALVEAVGWPRYLVGNQRVDSVEQYIDDMRSWGSNLSDDDLRRRAEEEGARNLAQAKVALADAVLTQLRAKS